MSSALVCVVFVFVIVVGSPLIAAREENDPEAQAEPIPESRQNYPQYANSFLHRPQIHRYPYPSKPGYYPHNYGNGYEYGHGEQHHHQQQQHHQQGLMEVLESIAARDELHCVSKILCDMASSSGGRRDNYGYKKPSGFINLDSLATLLSGVDDTLASPIVKFGKAFVLGYTSKHISQCQYAYPHCPSDPDRLAQYLNTQNGGLTHLLNNLPSIFPSPNRRIQFLGSRSHLANSFHIYDYSGDKRQYAWMFPSYDSEIHNYDNDGVAFHKKGKSLKFPNEHKYEKGYDASFYFPLGLDNHLTTGEETSTTEHNRGFVFRDFK